MGKHFPKVVMVNIYLSLSFASAIFRTGSGGGLFGCKMAASMGCIQWLQAFSYESILGRRTPALSVSHAMYTLPSKLQDKCLKCWIEKLCFLTGISQLTNITVINVHPLAVQEWYFNTSIITIWLFYLKHIV